MKRVSTEMIAGAIASGCASGALGARFNITRYGALLRARISDGLIDYAAPAERPDSLGEFLGALTRADSADFASWTSDDQETFILSRRSR